MSPETRARAKAFFSSRRRKNDELDDSSSRVKENCVHKRYDPRGPHQNNGIDARALFTRLDRLQKLQACYDYCPSFSSSSSALHCYSSLRGGGYWGNCYIGNYWGGYYWPWCVVENQEKYS